MKKILLVDDEPDTRNTVKAILEKEGYKVIAAIDGDDCLEKAKAEKPDLILLDIMMPGTPVRDVLPKLNTKVIFLTVVRTTEAEKEELLKTKNVVDFINKPFDLDMLVQRVKKSL